MFLHPREVPYLEDGEDGKIPLTVLVKMGEINRMTPLWQKHIGKKRVPSVHMDLPGTGPFLTPEEALWPWLWVTEVAVPI